MIRMKCPKCDKKLAVDDSKAGGIASCPECGQKFRIPGDKAQVPDRPQGAKAKSSAPRNVAPPKKVEAKPAPKPPQRPEESWEREDSSPYAVAPDPEPPPMPKKRRPRVDDGEDEFEDEEFGLDREYVKRRKAKKKKQESTVLGNGIGMVLLIMFLFCVAAGILSFVKVDLAQYVLWAGLAFIIIGRIWLLVLAGRVGWLTALGVFWIPFFDIYFAVTNWYDAGKALFIQYGGAIMRVIGAIALIAKAAAAMPQ